MADVGNIEIGMIKYEEMLRDNDIREFVEFVELLKSMDYGQRKQTRGYMDALKTIDGQMKKQSA